MPRLYCSKEDVKKYLPPNIVVEGTNPTPNYRNPNAESVFNIDIDFFVEQASDEIDGALSTQYDVPLKKVNFDGEISYPKPILEIAAILAAARIFEQKLQGADRQYSEAIKARVEWAYQQIYKIQNGELRIFGNRNTRGDRFVRGTLRGVPRNPAEGNRSKGGGT
jgi:phage gp36-like protein